MAADDVTIQLVTRCSSEEEFIERFARFATETDLVVPAQPDLSVGADGHFAISLKDRSVIMRGRCEVTEIRPIADAPGAPPGAATSARALMRLRLREMDAHSCGIHLRLMERHVASSGPPRAPAPAPGSVSVAAPAGDVSTGAIVAAAAVPSETEPTEISPAPRPETRAPGAAFTLPANPLGELAAGDLASFIELTLFESNTVADAPASSAEPVAAVAEAEPGSKGVTPAVARAALLAARLDRARRVARRVGPYVACALVGLLLGIALRSASGAAPVAEAPAPPPAAAPAAPSVPATVTPTIPTDDPQPSAVVAVRSSRRTGKATTGNVRVRSARARHAATERH